MKYVLVARTKENGTFKKYMLLDENKEEVQLTYSKFMKQVHEGNVLNIGSSGSSFIGKGISLKSIPTMDSEYNQLSGVDVNSFIESEMQRMQAYKQKEFEIRQQKEQQEQLKKQQEQNKQQNKQQKKQQEQEKREDNIWNQVNEINVNGNKKANTSVKATNTDALAGSKPKNTVSFQDKISKGFEKGFNKYMDYNKYKLVKTTIESNLGLVEAWITTLITVKEATNDYISNNLEVVGYSREMDANSFIPELNQFVLKYGVINVKLKSLNILKKTENIVLTKLTSKDSLRYREQIVDLKKKCDYLEKLHIRTRDLLNKNKEIMQELLDGEQIMLAEEKKRQEQEEKLLKEELKRQKDEELELIKELEREKAELKQQEEEQRKFEKAQREEVERLRKEEEKRENEIKKQLEDYKKQLDKILDQISKTDSINELNEFINIASEIETEASILGIIGNISTRLLNIYERCSNKIQRLEQAEAKRIQKEQEEKIEQQSSVLKDISSKITNFDSTKENIDRFYSEIEGSLYNLQMECDDYNIIQRIDLTMQRLKEKKEQVYDILHKDYSNRLSKIAKELSDIHYNNKESYDIQKERNDNKLSSILTKMEHEVQTIQNENSFNNNIFSQAYMDCQLIINNEINRIQEEDSKVMEYEQQKKAEQQEIERQQREKQRQLELEKKRQQEEENKQRIIKETKRQLEEYLKQYEELVENEIKDMKNKVFKHKVTQDMSEENYRDRLYDDAIGIVHGTFF